MTQRILNPSDLIQKFNSFGTRTILNCIHESRIIFELLGGNLEETEGR